MSANLLLSSILFHSSFDSSLHEKLILSAGRSFSSVFQSARAVKCSRRARDVDGSSRPSGEHLLGQARMRTRRIGGKDVRTFGPFRYWRPEAVFKTSTPSKKFSAERRALRIRQVPERLSEAVPMLTSAERVLIGSPLIDG